MIIQFVTFTSRLPEEEVRRRIDERAPRYRALDGLVQKLYVRDPQTGDYGGIYLWEDEEALLRFRRSALARTIPDTYQVEGSPRVEVLEVMSILRDEEHATLAAEA
jgi:hypothetical protein